MAEVLNIPEAVKYLRISEWKLRQLVAARAIPHFRPGGARRILFRKESLDAWMEQQEQEAISNNFP